MKSLIAFHILASALRIAPGHYANPSCSIDVELQGENEQVDFEQESWADKASQGHLLLNLKTGEVLDMGICTTPTSKDPVLVTTEDLGESVLFTLHCGGTLDAYEKTITLNVQKSDLNLVAFSDLELVSELRLPNGHYVPFPKKTVSDVQCLNLFRK